MHGSLEFRAHFLVELNAEVTIGTISDYFNQILLIEQVFCVGLMYFN